MKKIVVSLFTGAGGLDIGFEAAGYDVRVAVESDKACCDTLRLNRPTKAIIQKDIREVTHEEILSAGRIRPGSVTAVIGGPPCQGFSQLGKRNPNDPRNFLYREFLRIVEGLRPTMFLMENTSAIVNIRNRQVFLDIIQAAQKAGYATGHQVLNAVDFGVPQRRQRCFIVGRRMPDFASHRLPSVTVGQTIKDLVEAEVRKND
jgi:DNA (cytosine-5)-methyltransferase 1